MILCDYCPSFLIVWAWDDCVPFSVSDINNDNDSFNNSLSNNSNSNINGNVNDDNITIFIPVHDDVIKWKHFPRYWPFVRGIHRSPVNSPHKGQWRGALMFTLIWARINAWVNNREAGDLRRYRTHSDVIVMFIVGYILYPPSKATP